MYIQITMATKERKKPQKSCIKGANKQEYIDAREIVMKNNPHLTLGQAGQVLKEYRKTYKKDGTPKAARKETVWMKDYVKPAVKAVKDQQGGVLYKGQFQSILQQQSGIYRANKNQGVGQIQPLVQGRVQAQPIMLPNIPSLPGLVSGGRVKGVRKPRKY